MISASAACVSSGEKVLKNLRMVSRSGSKLLDNSEEQDSSIMSAWLLKKKSGPKSHFFSSTNRRFFTMDFGRQIFFYQHSESEKKISQPIPFRSIISVHPLTDSVADMADAGTEVHADQPMNVQRADSKTSLVSSLRKRMPSFSTPRSLRAPKEQHGFVIETVERPMALLCSSKAEADQWIAALQRAMLLSGNIKVEQAADTSTAASSRPTTACSFDSSLANTSCTDMSPKQSPPSSRPCSGSQTSQQHSVLAHGYVQSLQPEPKAHTAVLMPPKLPKRPVAKANSRSHQSNSEAGAPDKEMANEIEVTALEPEVIKATDGVTEYSAADATVQDGSEAWNAGQSTQVTQSIPRYHDKSEGLSWQQRLAQLDLSDDDDDSEEDPVPQASPVKNKSNVQAGAISSEPVTIEYCQPFTVDLPDSDEE
jgi:hypothetical protein